MAGISSQFIDDRNPAFHNFAAPAASAIRSAKAGAVGGGAKKCVKGKSCSATCIARNEDCLVEFPEPVQAEMRKMVSFLMAKRAKQGREIVPGSEEDISIGQAVTGVGQHLTLPKKLAKPGSKTGETEDSVAFPTTQSWGVKQALSAREIRELKKQRDTIGQSQDSSEVLKAWQRDTLSRGVKLDRQSLEDVYDSLPKAAQKQLNNSGNPNRKSGDKKFYYVDKDGNERTDGSSGTKSRGIAVLDMYLRQGGTDAYSTNTNRTFSPANLDVEHIKPVAKGGKDHPDNWVLARAGAQRGRADTHLGKWIDSLPNPDDKLAMQDYVSRNRKQTTARRSMGKLAEEARKGRKDMSDEAWYKLPTDKQTQTITLPSGKKETIIKPSAAKRYMFIDKDGNKDGFFGSTFLKNPDTTEGQPKAFSAPSQLKKAYSMLYKDREPEQVIKIRSQLKDAWEGFSAKGNYGAEEAADRMNNIIRKNLTENQQRLVQKDLEKSKQTLITKYGKFQGGGGKPSLDNLLADIQGKPAPAASAAPKPKAAKPKAAKAKPKTKKENTAPKPVKTQEERLAQSKQTAQALVNMYVSQGRSPGQIRDLLRQQRIPSSVINEVV